MLQQTRRCQIQILQSSNIRRKFYIVGVLDMHHSYLRMLLRVDSNAKKSEALRRQHVGCNSASLFSI